MDRDHKYRFHELVNTINGPGIIQGRIKRVNETHLLISHNINDYAKLSQDAQGQIDQRRDNTGHINAIWLLLEYKVDQVSKL